MNEKLREKFEIELRKHSIPTIRVELPKDQFGDYKFSQDQEKWKFYQLGLNSINTPKHETVEELREAYQAISKCWDTDGTALMCIYCHQWHKKEGDIQHKDNCIVEIAEQWLSNHGKPEIEG